MVRAGLKCHCMTLIPQCGLNACRSNNAVAYYSIHNETTQTIHLLTVVAFLKFGTDLFYLTSYKQILLFVFDLYLFWDEAALLFGVFVVNFPKRSLGAYNKQFIGTFIKNCGVHLNVSF